VVIGAGEADAVQPSLVLIDLVVESDLVDSEVRRDALQHPY
jgi:hypothetical protein